MSAEAWQDQYRAEEFETPVTARNRCRALGTALIQAEIDVKEARDVEVEAEQAFQSATRRAYLSPQAPAVERGGYTTKQLDAWVTAQAEDARREWKIAEARRQAAWNHYERINTQVMLAQSILRSIDRAFALGTGTEGP